MMSSKEGVIEYDSRKIVTVRDPVEVAKIMASKGRDDILRRECKHATFSQHRAYEMTDMLTTKEYLTFKDHVRVPVVRHVENYKRPYWITKEHLRDHPEKIEFEDLKNVDRYMSTQCRLREDIVTRLGYGNPSNPLRMLARSQYLYGLDVGPEVFYKRAIMDRFPDAFYPNHVTVIDAETNMASDWQEPILWSRVTDEDITLYVSKSWAHDIDDYIGEIINEFQENVDAYLEHIRVKFRKKDGSHPEFIDRILKLPIRVEMLSDHCEISHSMMKDIHRSNTDIVTGWGFFFDMSVVAESLQRGGLDAANVMSHPGTPSDFEMLYLRKGPIEKITSSGVKMNLEPQERWDKMQMTAGFKATCSMQTHWQLRKAKGKESGGYGLDALLTRHLGVGKVNFKQEDSIIPENTAPWHLDMQKYHKVRYGVYCIFDSIGVKIKDWKDKDMESQISALAGACDYSNFNSQPTVNVADMLFEGITKQKKVICSTSDQMETELDKRLLGKDKWIITFPTHNVHTKGQCVLKHNRHIHSTIFLYNSDADVATTYPVAEIINNLSKETTVTEPCDVEGIDGDQLRLVAVNITGGRVNSLEMMQNVCGLPKLDTWLEMFDEEQGT